MDTETKSEGRAVAWNKGKLLAEAAAEAERNLGYPDSPAADSSTP